MIDPNFQPPAAEVSREETTKRTNLLPWIKEYFDGIADSIIIGGSLSYGANYSVTPKSDIDVQLILNDTTLNTAAQLDLYDKAELQHALNGFRKGIFHQFSLVGIKDGVSIESHFWRKDAYIKAISYQTEQTPRLRSSIATPSTDYGFAFDGTSDAIDFYGEMIEEFPVSPFPSYRVTDGKLFLCRPITNILGGPIIIKVSPEVQAAVDTCWQESIARLREARLTNQNTTLVNALPSQYKMSPEAKAALLAKTDHLLAS